MKEFLNTAGASGVELFETAANASGGIIITKYIGKSAADVETPPQVDGKPITSIGDEAFVFNKLTSVVIPAGVTFIGDKAFCL
jgi:hypothetical protein